VKAVITAGGLSRCAAPEGGDERHAGEDRPDRCPEHCLGSACRLVSCGSRQEPGDPQAARASSASTPGSARKRSCRWGGHRSTLTAGASTSTRPATGEQTSADRAFRFRGHCCRTFGAGHSSGESGPGSDHATFAQRSPRADHQWTRRARRVLPEQCVRLRTIVGISESDKRGLVGSRKASIICLRMKGNSGGCGLLHADLPSWLRCA